MTSQQRVITAAKYKQQMTNLCRCKQSIDCSIRSQICKVITFLHVIKKMLNQRHYNQPIRKKTRNEYLFVTHVAQQRRLIIVIIILKDDSSLLVRLRLDKHPKQCAANNTLMSRDSLNAVNKTRTWS